MGADGACRAAFLSCGPSNVPAMTASTIRSQLKQKREQRVAAEKKVAEYRKKESDKRSAATRAASAARSTKSASTQRSKEREAARLEQDANAAGKNVASWSSRAAALSKEEAALQTRLSKAELDEAKAAEQKRQRQAADLERRRRQELAMVDRRASSHRHEFERRLTQAEVGIERLREPKPERLRVLILTAAAAGDLRVGRETKRIRDGIQAAMHRDLIELDVRTAATINDLLSGLTQGRPHVVHFSGHGAEDLIAFEEDADINAGAAVIRGEDFARVLGAVDAPPMLVVLNACDTAAQAQRLSETVASVAVGMSDSIGDDDAIVYAARFYSALVDGQSVQAAHDVARAALALNGSPEPDLPLLFEREPGLAAEMVLVLTPEA